MNFSSHIRIWILLLLCIHIACNESDKANDDSCITINVDDKFVLENDLNYALLASRMNSLDELKKVVELNYYSKGRLIEPSDKADRVEINFCSNGKTVKAVLTEGESQSDIIKARDGDFIEKVKFVFRSPYAVANREDMRKIYLLSRRRSDLFGWEDEAFFDLAEYASNKLIRNLSLACLDPKDCGEKGYLNSFNHITAQALITTCFSEELADYIADVHERYNMPELVSGVFTVEQLNDPNNNPIDNYVDLINNEIGQELGKRLAKQFNIDQKTIWTPTLLKDYLNELQVFYASAFNIQMLPFNSNDLLIIRFSEKLNLIMDDERLKQYL